MDLAGIKASTDELTHEAVPMILKGIADDVAAVTGAIAAVSDRLVSVVIPAFADGVSQVLSLGQRLANGIYIELPEIQFLGPIKIWSPLLPVKDESK